MICGEATEEGMMGDPKKELDYTDDVPDDEEAPSPYEPTYRDGSTQNECWAGEDR